MSVKLLFRGATYGGSQLVQKGFGFVLLPIMAHYLGAEGVGTVAVLLVVGSFLSLCYLQGVPGAWVRLRFDEAGAAGIHELETTIFWYVLFSAASVAGVLALFGRPLAEAVLPGIAFSPLVIYVVIGSACSVFLVLLQRKLQAEERPSLFVAITLGYACISFVLAIFMVVVLERGAQGQIEGWMGANLLMLVVSVLVIRPGPPWRSSRSRLTASLRYGWPLLPHTLAAFGNDLADRLLVNKILGAAEAGIYSTTYQIAALTVLGAVALNQSVMPVYIRLRKDAEAHDTGGASEMGWASRVRATNVGVWLVAASCALAVLLTGVMKEVLELLLPAKFHGGWLIVAPLQIGFVAWAFYFPIAQALFYDTRTVRIIPLVTAASVAVNIVANLVLLPRLGIMGAAIATLVSFVVNAAVALLALRRTDPMPYPWRRYAAMLTVAISAVVGLWFIDGSSFPIDTRLAIKGMMMAITFAVLYLILRPSWETE